MPVFQIKRLRFLGEIVRKCANVYNSPFRDRARNVNLGYHILPESKEVFEDKWGCDKITY